MAYIWQTYGTYSANMADKLGSFRSKLDKLRAKSEVSGEGPWSVWIVSTRLHVSLVAANGLIDNAIPFDGTFEYAYPIQWDLTEEEADILMDELNDQFSELEKSP